VLRRRSTNEKRGKKDQARTAGRLPSPQTVTVCEHPERAEQAGPANQPSRARCPFPVLSREGGKCLEVAQVAHSYFDFQQRPPETPYYEKDGWFEDMRGAEPDYGEPKPIGMIVLGDRRPRPTPRDVLRESLAWDVDLARISHRAALPNHVCGLAGYQFWEGLEAGLREVHRILRLGGQAFIGRGFPPTMPEDEVRSLREKRLVGGPR
jgi:hypothetical protein